MTLNVGSTAEASQGLLCGERPAPRCLQPAKSGHEDICCRRLSAAHHQPLLSMTPNFHFTLEPDWRTAPLAFWVHVPVDGSTTECVPPAPVAVLHKGFMLLHVDAADVDLQFSSLAQLDHFIEVMEATPLPTSRQLSRKRGLPVGPNSHWSSRLPAKLKAPKERVKLVAKLRGVREQLLPLGASWHSYSRLL